MDAVRAFRDLKRERKEAKARDSVLIAQEQRLDELIREYVEAGKLAVSMSLKNDGGGSVFQKHEIWASIKDGVDLARVKVLFQKYDMMHLYNDKPNSTSLSGFMRKELSDDKLKSAEERAIEGGVAAELLEIIDLTDKYKTSANGL